MPVSFREVAVHRLVRISVAIKTRWQGPHRYANQGTALRFVSGPRVRTLLWPGIQLVKKSNRHRIEHNIDIGRDIDKDKWKATAPGKSTGVYYDSKHDNLTVVVVNMTWPQAALSVSKSGRRMLRAE